MTPTPEQCDRDAAGFIPDEREAAAIRHIGAEQELSDQAVIRQALRFYQMVHERMKAGETFSFSGDAERAAEFAALSATRPAAAQGEDEVKRLCSVHRKIVPLIEAREWDFDLCDGDAILDAASRLAALEREKGEMREAAQELLNFIGDRDMRVYSDDPPVRNLRATLESPTA